MQIQPVTDYIKNEKESLKLIEYFFEYPNKKDFQEKKLELMIETLQPIIRKWESVAKRSFQENIKGCFLKACVHHESLALRIVDMHNRVFSHNRKIASQKQTYLNDAQILALLKWKSCNEKSTLNDNFKAPLEWIKLDSNQFEVIANNNITNSSELDLSILLHDKFSEFQLMQLTSLDTSEFYKFNKDIRLVFDLSEDECKALSHIHYIYQTHK